MRRALLVAQREFLSTLATKAFVFAALVTPVAMGALLALWPRMMADGPLRIEGEVAIVDPTGRVTAGVEAFLQPARLAERRARTLRRIQEALPSAVRAVGQADRAVETALGDVPVLRVVEIPAAADRDAAKAALWAERQPGAGGLDRLALVVIQPDALKPSAGQPQAGSYDLYVRSKLDDRIEREIQDGVRHAIVAARLEASGLDAAAIETLTSVDRVTSRTVTPGGEDRTSRALNQLMPAMFMALLLVSVMTSGQYLLTTTIEEKSNRVAEVLLSAVSPMELMVGKIVGQMGVGLLVLVLYLAIGLMALVTFASLGLLDPVLIVFLFVFFFLAYLSIGAFMAAIGAAVRELREAQGLMAPVMMVIMIPWLLWLPISRDPNSMFAVALSFIPPVSNFVMMLRLASTAPPPLWQAVLAVVAGGAGVVASLWFAGKVFRIGLLLHGKPPSLATLVRWVRTA